MMLKVPDAEDLHYFPGLAAFPGVKLWKLFWLEGDYPAPGEAYVCDWRSYDIKQTMISGVRSAPSGCVAFTFCDRVKPLFGDELEAEAAKRGAIVLWWSGPPMTNEERIFNGMSPV